MAEKNKFKQLEFDVEIEDESQDENIPYKYSITAYGADYPVDSLVTRMQSKDIFIPPFQRNFVWSFKQASRFVESLLLGLPVPGIFFAKEDKTNKLLVIDGQQRLRTLEYFFSGIFRPEDPEERNFILEGVQKDFEGKTYATLSDDDRRKINDSLIHAIIVRQDEPSDDDNSSIYHIFERLNTGGRILTPQEIRSSIFHGGFSKLLRELNADSDWRSIFGPVNKYMRDQELILRFFALYYNLDKYEKPMKDFLNKYMSANKNLSKRQSEDELTKLFTTTIKSIHHTLGSKVFRRSKVFNAAYFDATMVGYACRLQQGPIVDKAGVQEAYELLIKKSNFRNASENATTDENNVKKRIELATKAFSHVK